MIVITEVVVKVVLAIKTTKILIAGLLEYAGKYLKDF